MDHAHPSCPLSPTFFGLYIKHGDGKGIDILVLGTPIHILLYVNDIILVSESDEYLQQLNILDGF